MTIIIVNGLIKKESMDVKINDSYFLHLLNTKIPTTTSKAAISIPRDTPMAKEFVVFSSDSEKNMSF